MKPSQNFFSTLINNSFKFRLYLFYKLPAAFFSGVRVKEFNSEKCVTTVPLKWFTQNPFKSTYFASLAMAAEMSTGMLALGNTYKSVPPISMLVIKMEAFYFKKAVGNTYFTCIQGKEIAEIIDDAIKTNESKSITVKSTGKNEAGDSVAEFLFTWSFKVKSGSKQV